MYGSEQTISISSRFLLRFQDISTEVRLQCIRSSVDMLVSHPKLRKEITGKKNFQKKIR